MRLNFLRFFTRAWTRRLPILKKISERRQARLLVELLESRELLAAVPTLVTGGILPVVSTSTPTGTPLIQVQYSEPMTNSVLNANNYFLVGASGASVPVNGVISMTGSSNTVVQLAYNSSLPLVVDTYTLYVRGQNMIDQDDGFAMAQPGQLIVANGGRNNVGVVNLPGDGTLGGLSNYNLSATLPATASPNEVAFGDVDGDGIKDLLLVKAGTDELVIFQGQPAAFGGGFKSAPAVTLALPPGVPAGTVNLAESIAVGDFDLNTKLDIAVACFSSDTVTVFLNTSATTGVVSFGAGTSTTVDASPVGIAVADFDGDTNLDLAVAVSTAPSDLNADTINDYRVNILPGTPTGAFGAVQAIRIGDVAPTGLQTPTSIVAGVLSADTLPDLVVGGTLSLMALTNTSSAAGVFTFNNTPALPALLGVSTVVSVGLAKIDNNASLDLVMTTTGNTLVAFPNTSAGPALSFGAPVSFNVATGTAGKLAIGDLNTDGFEDVVISNASAAGRVTVMRNDSSRAGAVATATAAAGVVTITTAAAHGLLTGDQVTIAAVVGGSNLNGTNYTITVLNATQFTYASVGATGPGAGGTFATNVSLAPMTGGPFAVDGSPIGVAIADTNQDNILDVVTANNTGNDFSLLLGRGDTSLQSSTNYALTPTVTTGIAVADLNGDNIPDLTIINNNGATNNSNVSIMQGLNGGGYANAVNFQPYNSGISNWTSVAVGDINNDTRPDIIFTSAGGDRIGLMLNNITVPGAAFISGGPTPSFSAGNDFGVGRAPTQVVTGDFNKDGKLDLVMAHNGGGGGWGDKAGVQFYRGNGDGTFQSRDQYDDDNGMLGVVAGDFNRDGNLDFIAVEDNSSGKIWVHYGDGAGGFTAFGGSDDGYSFDTGTLSNPGSIAAADFNGDGFLDVIVTSRDTGPSNVGVAVLLNVLGTSFASALQSDVIPGTALQTVITNDVNQDGFADAIVTTRLNAGSTSIQNIRASGSLIEIRNFTNHGLVTGDQVTITGGNIAAAIGTWTITVTSGSRFTLDTSVWPGGFYTGGASWVKVQAGITTNDNVFVLIGDGTGKFHSPMPYLIGGTGSPFLAPSYLGATTSPLLFVTSFDSGGTLVGANLVINGDFEARDLNNEQGNMLGWQTFKLNLGSGGSHGDYRLQTLDASPLSSTTVPSPTGSFSAMLDQGLGYNNPDRPTTHEGTHLLYQDVTVPAITVGETVKLSFSLFADNADFAGGWTDTSVAVPTLNYTDVTPLRTSNHQVRVDVMATHPITGAINASSAAPAVALVGSINANTIVITSLNHGLMTGTEIQILGVQGNVAANGLWKITRIDANRFGLNSSASGGTYTGGGYWTRPLDITAATSGGDVLLNPFITGTATPTVFTQNFTNIDLSAFAGQTIRLRFASSNNLGRLLVGVDNVKLVTQFSDTVTPTLSGFGVRNASFFAGSVAHTADPTLIGTIGDNTGVAGVKFVQFDVDNDGFESTDPKTNQWDATGNFSFTLPTPNLGLNTIPVRVVDKAGNINSTTYQFFMQSNSVTEWQAIGPQGIAIDVSQGVDYSKVAGRVTAIVSDKSDPTGNTYIIGSANGGIWRSVNGGFDWTPVTNSITDGSGNPVSTSIGGIGQSRSNPSVLYAGTGVGDRQLGSQQGVGVLKSIDGGRTWALAGDSGVVMLNARTTKVTVDADNANVAYVAVASDATGTFGAIYKTTDGGLTWNNVFLPSRMTDATGAILGAAAQVSSVTDLVIDPFNSSRIFAGVGNIGVDNVDPTDPDSTGGLWVSTNYGLDWYQEEGGDSFGTPVGVAGSGRLPVGLGVGRVTVAMGNGRPGDETTIYILVSSPPGNNIAPNVDFGNFTSGPEPGLYKGVDGLLDFTKVMLKQDISGPGFHNFVDINLMGNDAANTGALVVDPTNANVVYVGGSDFWQNGGLPTHNFIRVDTGNMRDTTYRDPRAGNTIPNDGDDIDKADKAEDGNHLGFYDGILATDPYNGEGVYWYDLTENQSGDDGNVTLLPNQITSLMFDAQGRLLIGTSGGIWRGMALGFDYDDTSGNDGILRPGGGPGPAPAAFSVPAMTFTSINGNLQIADMTSVAIDSVTRGVYYTTQYGTGVAKFDTVAGWVSQGLTGPFVNGQNLNIPNAAAVLAADPPPGSAAGTPVTLFRIWQFADPLALRPEVSADNGSTWGSIAAGGINITGNTAGTFPGFAVNPTSINLSGIDQNQLLYGTNYVFLSSTNGIQWDAKPAPNPAPPLSGAGGLISAMSFAPSTSNTFYVGTDIGEFFYTTDGGGTWAQGGAAVLPTTRLNAIAVDPTNANTVFALFGGNTGAAGHVWRSTNGGVSWVDVRTLSPALPNVAAYAMVVDPSVNLGAANGKIYLATQVGVYYSLNGGNTWLKLGQGMPNVPVVDLKASGTQGVLAAATLGRGVYTINTNALSFIPDQVIDEDQTSPAIPFTVNDPGLAPGSYTVTATSSNAALIANAGIVIAGTGANRTIQFTPKPHANSNGPVNNVGPATITVTVTSGSFTYSQAFQVTVNFINYAPTISNIPSQTTLQDQPLTINFAVSDVETAAGALVVTAASSNLTLVPNGNLVLGGAGANRSLAITPAPGQTGTVQITLTATDADGSFSTRVIDLLVTAVASLPFSDDFTRSDSIFLGPGWKTEKTTTTSVVSTGGFAGTTNLAFSPANASTANLSLPTIAPIVGTSIASLNQLAVADAALQANINLGGGVDVGLIARYSGTGGKNYYVARIFKDVATNTFKAGIYKNVAGTETLISTLAPVSSGTGVLRFEVVGASLKLFFQPTSAVPPPTPPAFTNSMPLVTYAIDTTFPAVPAVGMNYTVGVETLKGNVAIDDFSADKIILLTPSLPYNDSFTAANGDQFSRNWSSQKGNFTVNNNAMTGQAAANLATVNGSQTNMSIQANVSLSATGQQAGVIAHYNNGSYYYAQIYKSATAVTATIYRVTNGVFTALSTAVSIGISALTVRLEIAGPSLRMYINGAAQPTAYGYDFSYASGLSGVYATANAVVDEYQSDAITLTSPGLAFTDNFAQSDGPLSRNWNDKSGNFKVQGNILFGAATGTAPVPSVATINGSLANGAIEADVKLAAVNGQEVGVIARYNGENNYYVGKIYAQLVSGQIKYFATILRATTSLVNGVKTLVQSALTIPVVAAPITGPIAGTLRLEAAGPSLKLFYNGTLVCYGFDSTYAAGTFGVRATNGNAANPAAGTSLTRVTLDGITLLTPGFTFFDNFAQADGTPLSRNWSERGGNYNIESGVLKGKDASLTNLNFATVNSTVLDTAVQADVVLSPGTATAVQQAQLVVRYNAVSKTGYVAVVYHSGSKVTANLAKLTSTGALTVLTTVFPLGNNLATTTGAYAANLRLEVVGKSIKLFVDGALRAYAYDATLTAAGLDGVRSTKNVTFANFQADEVILITPSVPPGTFVDPLSQPAGTQLDRNWDERVGNFSAASGAFVGNSADTPAPARLPTNFATVHGVSLDNVVVQADVTVSSAPQGTTLVGQRAQLIARYNPTSGRAYVADIFNSGANVYAGLYILNADGTTTALTNSYPLGSNVLANGGAPFTGTVRFEVAGTDLKLFVNGNLVAYAYATLLDPAAAGYVGYTGIRGSRGANASGAGFANFSVAQLVLNSPPLPFTDNFNTTAGNQLSTDWLERSGNFSTLSNTITGTMAGINLATVNASAGLADGAVNLNVNVPAVSGQYAGVVARYGATGYYYAQVRFTGAQFVAEIYRSNLATPLATVNLASGLGTLRLEFAGPSLKLFIDGVLKTFTYDSTFTTGTSGVRTSGTPLNTVNRANIIPSLNAFSLGAITLNTPGLPFTDLFGLPDNSPISRDWTERNGVRPGSTEIAGTFNILNNELAPDAAVPTRTTFATANIAAIGDVAVDANFNLGDVNVVGKPLNSVGIAARFTTNAAGLPSYYVGVIEKVGTGFQAQIFKVVNGAFTALTTMLPVSSADSGLLHMEVAGNSIKLFFNGAIVAYANDATPLAAGAVGIRTINSTVADFTASAILLANPSLPFVDTFSQTAGSQLTDNWLNRGGNYKIGNSGVDVAGDSATVIFPGGPSNIATVNITPLDASMANVDVAVGANQNAGVVLRYSSAGYYLGRIVNVPISASTPTGFVAQIYRVVTSGATVTATLLASANVPVGTGTLSFQAVGTSLKLLYTYNNPVPTTILAAYAHDNTPTLALGQTGVASSKSVVLDNFSTAAITVPTTQLFPFTDTFAPGLQLSSNWLERAGTFDLTTGDAVSKARTNLATVNGFTGADVDLQMTVAPLTLSQQAALVARYSGPLDTNFYMGSITNTGTNQYAVAIYKKIGGSLITIMSANVTAFAGSLRFQVVGNTLKLFVDGVAILTATDSQISAAGGVGIRTANTSAAQPTAVASAQVISFTGS